MSNVPLITYIISPYAIPCSIIALIVLLLALVVWEKRSPVIIFSTVLVLLILLAQFSFLFWLVNSWGQPYIRWKHPICKIK